MAPSDVLDSLFSVDVVTALQHDRRGWLRPAPEGGEQEQDSEGDVKYLTRGLYESDFLLKQLTAYRKALFSVRASEEEKILTYVGCFPLLRRMVMKAHTLLETCPRLWRSCGARTSCIHASTPWTAL